MKSRKIDRMPRRGRRTIFFSVSSFNATARSEKSAGRSECPIEWTNVGAATTFVAAAGTFVVAATTFVGATLTFVVAAATFDRAARSCGDYVDVRMPPERAGRELVAHFSAAQPLDGLAFVRPRQEDDGARFEDRPDAHGDGVGGRGGVRRARLRA